MERFDPFVEFYGLTRRHCDRPVSDLHLERISRSCFKYWKLLPDYLGLKTVMVHDIDRSLIDEESKRLEFLRQWKIRKGSEATYTQLISALLSIDQRSDAEAVCNFLAQSMKSAPIKTVPTEVSNQKSAVLSGQPLISQPTTGTILIT